MLIMVISMKITFKLKNTLHSLRLLHNLSKISDAKLTFIEDDIVEYYSTENTNFKNFQLFFEKVNKNEFKDEFDIINVSEYFLKRISLYIKSYQNIKESYNYSVLNYIVNQEHNEKMYQMYFNVINKIFELNKIHKLNKTKK